MTDAPTLSILKQILGSGDQATHARFLEAVGDLTIRPAVRRNTYPIKSLLWRFNDLKPHVRESLETEVRNRWQAFTPESRADADGGTQNNPSSSAPPKPVAPIPETIEGVFAVRGV